MARATVYERPISPEPTTIRMRSSSCKKARMSLTSSLRGNTFFQLSYRPLIYSKSFWWMIGLPSSAPVNISLALSFYEYGASLAIMNLSDSR